MSTTFALQTRQAVSKQAPATPGRILQRQCVCGNHTMAGGKCEECSKEKRLGLQTKLKVNEPGDVYEQEADRIADQVMATQMHQPVSEALPRIQRYSEHSTGQTETAPVTIDHNLAGPSRPLEAINPPADPFEQEADAIASAVVSGHASRASRKQSNGKVIQTKRIAQRITPLVQRQIDEEIEEVDEEEDAGEVVQTKSLGHSPSEVSGEVGSEIESLRGSGRPMSESERSYFEPVFGYDFSSVRIHTDSRSANAAGSVGARAFTIGNDVVFGAGEYDTTSKAGRHLVAHELTHVIQQNVSANPTPLQQQVIQRKPEETRTVVRVVIYVKHSRVVITLSDGSTVKAVLTKNSLQPGAYTANHITGDREDDVLGEPGNFWFDRTEPPIDYADLATNYGYELIVYGVRKPGTRVEEIPPSPAETSGEGHGLKGSGTAETGEGRGEKEGKEKKKGEEATEPGKEGTQEGKEGATGIKKVEGEKREPETDEEKKKRLEEFYEKLRNLGAPKGETMDPAAQQQLKEMDAAQQEDLLRYLKDVQNQADEDIDPKEFLDKYLKMTPAERELIRVNLELKKTEQGGGLPEKVQLQLQSSAEKTAQAAKNVKAVNEKLAELQRIHAMVTKDTPIDQESASLDPIDLERLPMFREMMMLEGLLAGASTKSPEIESAAKDLTSSIAGLRDYVFEEIAWMAAELAVGAIFTALTGPIGGAVTAVRAANLLRRLNNLRKLLQKIQSAYSTIQRIEGIISRVLAGYDQYKKFEPQFRKWMAEVEALRETLDDPNIEEELTEQAAEHLEELEERVMDKVHEQLESGSGIGAILDYFDIPDDATDEDLKEILFNIPRGVEELKGVKELYDRTEKDIESVKLLAFRSVLVGVLLYPFVGALAKEIGGKLGSLMSEKDLGDRLLGMFSRASAGRKGYKPPGKKTTKARLQKAKKSKEQKAKEKEERAKKKQARKAAEEEQKKKDKDKKAKDAAHAADEWSQVVKKVAKLPDQHKEKGATETKLKSQAKAIRNKHKKVAGKVKVDPIPGKGFFRVVIQRKPVGDDATAEVLMGYKARWAQGKEEIEKKVTALSLDQLTNPGLTSAINPLKDSYQYTTLKVVNRQEEDRSGFSIVGTMGKQKERVITSTEDLSELHYGTETDPIPLHWYKHPTNYPKQIKLKIGEQWNSYGMDSIEKITRPQGGQVRIGIDMNNLIQEDSVVKRNSKHKRSGTVQHNFREVLEGAGYQWGDKDADHVKDLAFEGRDSYENLWPLNKDINRHAYNNMWYMNYSILYLDRKNPRKANEGTLYNLQGRWFRVLDFKTKKRRWGGRTGKWKAPSKP